MQKTSTLIFCAHLIGTANMLQGLKVTDDSESHISDCFICTVVTGERGGMELGGKGK